MGDETIKDICDRMLRDSGRGPFHLSDGAYFWRDREGVHLVIAETAKDDAAILRHFVFDTSSWASAVACTTIEGETGMTFRIADALLG